MRATDDSEHAHHLKTRSQDRFIMEVIGCGQSATVVRVNDDVVKKIIPKGGGDAWDYLEEITAELYVHTLVKDIRSGVDGRALFSTCRDAVGDADHFVMTLDYCSPLTRASDNGIHVDAMVVAADIAESLAVLHANGLAHGDVCRKNVLVAETGRARLCDFGLSSLSVSNLVHLTYCRGLPEMVPLYELDLWDDRFPVPEGVDMAQVDMWMLGCALFEMTHSHLCWFYVKRPSWDGANAYKNWQKFKDGEFLPKCTYPNPAKLYALLRKLLAPAEHRWTAAALFKDLTGHSFVAPVLGSTKPNDHVKFPPGALRNGGASPADLERVAFNMSQVYTFVPWQFWLIFACVMNGEEHVLGKKPTLSMESFVRRHFGHGHITRPWFYDSLIAALATRARTAKRASAVTPETVVSSKKQKVYKSPSSVSSK